MKKVKPVLEDLIKDDMFSKGYDENLPEDIIQYWEDNGITLENIDVNYEVEIIGIKSINPDN